MPLVNKIQINYVQNNSAPKGRHFADVLATHAMPAAGTPPLPPPTALMENFCPTPEDRKSTVLQRLS